MNETRLAKRSCEREKESAEWCTVGVSKWKDLLLADH